MNILARTSLAFSRSFVGGLIIGVILTATPFAAYRSHWKPTRADRLVHSADGGVHIFVGFDSDLQSERRDGDPLFLYPWSVTSLTGGVGKWDDSHAMVFGDREDAEAKVDQVLGLFDSAVLTREFRERHVEGK